MKIRYDDQTLSRLGRFILIVSLFYVLPLATYFVSVCTLGINLYLVYKQSLKIRYPVECNQSNVYSYLSHNFPVVVV